MSATQISKLWQLQQLDLQRRKLQQQLAQPKHQAEHDQAQAAARQALQKLKACENTIDELQKKIRRAELDLAAVEAEIKESETSLYGGSITNSRELSAREQKLAQARSKRSRQEDALLTMMQELETYQQSAAKQRAQAKELTRRFKTAQASLIDETAQLRQELEQATIRRQQLADTVDPVWLARYTKMQQQRPDAIALLEGASCGACHVLLPNGLINQTGGDEPTYCESCGRLLCLP